MRPVTKEEFFARINPLDVHPVPYGQWDSHARDYRTRWTMQDGTRHVVGVSFGDQYWLEV